LSLPYVVGSTTFNQLKNHPGFVPKGPAMTQSQKDLQKFHRDIAIHAEMLVTEDMRQHACADPVEHDLAFQVYRLLQGYGEAFDIINEFLEPCSRGNGRDATGHRCHICHGLKYRPKKETQQ
jgi:hypothetical protein